MPSESRDMDKNEKVENDQPDLQTNENLVSDLLVKPTVKIVSSDKASDVLPSFDITGGDKTVDGVVPMPKPPREIPGSVPGDKLIPGDKPVPLPDLPGESSPAKVLSRELVIGLKGVINEVVRLTEKIPEAIRRQLEAEKQEAHPNAKVMEQNKDDRIVLNRGQISEGRHHEVATDSEKGELNESLVKQKDEMREQVIDQAVKAGLSGERLNAFKDGLQSLEKRSASDFEGVLPNQELLNTYSQISRLLNAKTHSDAFSNEQILNIAEQIVGNAGNPIDSIAQGHHNTCAAAAIENVLYSKSPSVVAKMVTDIALTDKFKTADGSEIIRVGDPSLDKESLIHPPQDGTRSLANKLFQEGAINAFWQRQTVDQSNFPCAKGSVFYAQLAAGGKKDTGERLISSGRDIVKQLSNADGDPNITAARAMEMYEQITGKAPFLFGVDGRSSKNGFVQPKSEAELAEMLTSIKSGSAFARFPIFVGISGPGDIGHAMVIKDFDPRTGKVSIDNSHDRAGDYLGKRGGQEKVPVKLLFKAFGN